MKIVRARERVRKVLCEKKASRDFTPYKFTSPVIDRNLIF